MRRSVKYTLLAFIIVDIIAALLIGGYIWAAKDYWVAPHTKLTQPREVIIPKGTPFRAVVDILAEEDIIEYPWLFTLVAYEHKHHLRYKAGEYMFDAYSSPAQVSEKLVEGDVLVRSLTFPEGWLSEQIVQKLQAEPLLTGDITDIPEEGSLMPDTYRFVRGESRMEILTTMQRAMQKAIDAEWEKRAPDLPYRTKEEAVIMASIIEKETGVAAERDRIAGVFVNRLRSRMKLQSDPTANYGIYKETGNLKTRLSAEDVQHYSVYNTYVIEGLPATPICNVSRASIHAALHPAETDEYYFVADGEGGHVFARTLSEHNRNVAAYRKRLQLLP
jgi:UPF0755 protein